MRRLLLAVMLCVGTLSMWAVPAKRLSFTVKQPDGTQLTIVQHGDEHFHYFTTEDGVLLKKSAQGFFYAQSTVENRLVATMNLAHNAAERSVEEQVFVQSLPQLSEVIGGSRARSMNRRSIVQQKTATPVTGNVKVPVILVQYKDKKFAQGDPTAEFHELLNSEEPFTDRRGYASARKYFMDQSEGQFAPTFDVLGPVTLSKNMEYYGGNDEEGSDLRPAEMIEEACRLVNSTADFKEYDNNGDGYVDFVYVIYAGYGEASNTNELENTIWPHAWALPTPLSADGVKVQRYACSNELYGYQGSTLAGIGTLCHEFSHCLGLPDFYDIDYSGGFGLSSWSIMSSGNYNDDGYTPCGYTGYEKDYIGWKSLVVLNEPQDVTLHPMSEGGNACKIVNDANENEYYVVENHKKTNWDKYISAEGMLVFHVDYLKSAWDNNGPNDDPNHQRMTLIPADNKLTDATLRGDTYPGSTGNTALTTTSTPAAKVYKGEFMYKDITNIAMNGDVVTFSFMKGALPVPQVHELTDITADGFTVSWEEILDISEYEVCLEKMKKSPYMLEEDFGKVKAGSADIGSSLANYTIQEGWLGVNVFGLDGAIRLGTTSQQGGIMSPTFKCDSTCYTIFVTLRKCSATDKDAGVLISVGDDAWEYLHGGIGTIDNEDWVTYTLVLDTIGENTYLYMDTRDNENTKESEGLRVDIDDIYILPGDWTETEEDEGTTAAAPRRTVRHIEASRMSRPMDKVVTGIVQMQKSQSATETYIDFIDEQRYYVTPIHTARTAELSYRFDNLDGGLYRTTVRSVRGSIYSRYSNVREVELVDSMLPQTLMPTIYMDNDSVYVEVDDADAAVYYTLDGSTPTAYSARYTAPFVLDSKAMVNVIARKEGHRRSDVVEFDNWFAADGATYRIVSTVNPQASVSAAMSGNSAKDYVGDVIVGDEVWHDSVVYVLTGIDSHAFSGATALRSIEVSGQHLQSVGDSLFHGCAGLNAVVWDIDTPVLATMFDKNYHNLLVYLPDTMQLAHPLVDSHDMTLVRGGHTEALMLNYQYSFYAPRSFTAAHVTYSRYFTQSTGLGTSAGWETVVLPFDVQRITHASKGDIAPFGQGAKYSFWLAELAADGFKAASAIRANTPYLIAMPNNTEYGDNSLSGQITFTADDVTVHATDEVTVTEGPDFMFVPTYAKVEANDSVYALNVSKKHDTYAAGSVFAPGMYDANPFTAYVVPLAGHHSAPLYRIHMQPEPEVEVAVPAFAVEAREGVIYVTLPEARTVVVYDMVGRQVCAVACKAGVNAIAHLKEGFYLVEKTKVYVKR